jgi:hypothetical protein
VLGTLAMLGGTLQSFRQLKTLTHICGSDHSNFFLSFVKHVSSMSDEYIFMPRTPEELGSIMRHYEEVGLPVLPDQLMLFMLNGQIVPQGTIIVPRVRSPIRPLLLSASLILIAAFSEFVAHSLEVIMISTLSRLTKTFVGSARGSSLKSSGRIMRKMGVSPRQPVST